MKILFVSSSSGSRGGGEIYLLYLGRALASFGHEVLLWASADERMDPLAASFASFGSVMRAPYQNTYDRLFRGMASVFNSGTVERIATQWREARPDVMHVNKQNLEDGLDLLQTADQGSIPSICTIHITQSASFLDAQFASVRDWGARRVLRQYGGPLVAVQDQRACELEQFLGRADHVKSINNGVELYDLPLDSIQRAETRQRFGIDEEELLFVGVGRIETQKRPLYFLEVAKRIHAQWSEARFLWVGDGSLRSTWDQEIDALGLRDIVQCAGWQDDVEPFLAAGDVFLHVAEFEGLPLALIEAMSAGLPCALPASLVDDFEVIDRDHVMVLDEWDTFLDSVQNPARRKAIADRGRQLVERKLSVEHMARQYEALYRSVTQTVHP